MPYPSKDEPFVTHGFIKRRPKRLQHHRLGTAVRKIVRTFEKLLVDTKHVDNIPGLLPAI